MWKISGTLIYGKCLNHITSYIHQLYLMFFTQNRIIKIIAYSKRDLNKKMFALMKCNIITTVLFYFLFFHWLFIRCVYCLLFIIYKVCFLLPDIKKWLNFIAQNSLLLHLDMLVHTNKVNKGEKQQWKN